MTTELWFNPHVGVAGGGAPSRAPLELHRRLPGYLPSLLAELPGLARRQRISKLWVKDESGRLGLPSFKILGASWGVYRALEQRFGPLSPWRSLDELRTQLRRHTPLGLTAATDGNHGRAVARMARLLGLEARIFVPSRTSRARIDAIESEGALCQVVHGTYDDAVARSAAEASDTCLVISDTSWPGYEDVPRWVIEGYSTIFWEVDDQLAEREEPGPDVVVIQVGVGALAAAAARHYRRGDTDRRVVLIGVEPTRAACVLESARAGKRVAVPGPHDSIMAGLNCGTPSLVAWPVLSSAFHAFVAIEDDAARAGMRALAQEGIVSGETGAAGVGALLELASADDTRAHLGIDDSSRVLCLSTEGATDPAAYRKIVGNATV